MATASDTAYLWETIRSFLQWIDKNGYESHDPYDLWGSSYGIVARRLYYRNRFIGIPLMAPIVLMELLWPQGPRLWVLKKRFPNADALILLGYLQLFSLTQERLYLQKALDLAGDLLKSSIPGYSGHCWGYPFNWQNNQALWKKNTPLITVTPYCFDAFLALYDQTGAPRYKEVAHSISRFVFYDLNESYLDAESSACSYAPIDHCMVINANAYRAYVLLEAAHRFNEDAYPSKALRNLNFVLRSQRSDGSWLYAMGNPQDAFIDNFHTAFVLKSLFKLNAHLHSSDVDQAIRRGYAYYRTNLWTSTGVPKTFALARRFQVVRLEMYDVAEAIALGTLLGPMISEALRFAEMLAKKVHDDYQLPEGYFLTKIQMGGLRDTVPFIRWPQAQMFFALTSLLKSMTAGGEGNEGG
jgi:hypothetical protein